VAKAGESSIKYHTSRMLWQQLAGLGYISALAGCCDNRSPALGSPPHFLEVVVIADQSWIQLHISQMVFNSRPILS
jgi:hypothetical protein